MALPGLFAPGSRPRGFRELIAVVALQSFGNTMGGSFWLVFLVSEPQSLPFSTAVLVWLLAFGAASMTVLVLARGRPIRATAAMTVGLAVMVLGHLALATLPAIWGLVGGALGFGLYIPAFWLPLNVLLARETSAANRAGRMAGVTATFTVVSVVAPALGGLIAEAVGYRVLFALAASVVAANLLLVRLLAQREETHSFTLAVRRLGPRVAAAFGGQGAVEGVLSVATPLASFLFTTAAVELGLLFAVFALAAGVTTLALGRASDRVRSRGPFLVLGALLAVPAALLASVSASSDLGTFAFAVGWLSMATAIAPSFIFTIAVDRMEDVLPQVSATREFILNVSRTIALALALLLLTLGVSVGALFVLVGAAAVLEAFAK